MYIQNLDHNDSSSTPTTVQSSVWSNVAMGLILVLVTILASLLPRGQAQAQSDAPFQCSPDFFQVVNNLGSGIPYEGNFNRLYKLDPETGDYTLIQTNDIGPYNGISYNIEDDYIYGIMGGSNHLLKIGSDGVGQDLGAISGLPSGSIFVGAFDLHGNLYIRRGSAMYRIDVSTQTASQISLSAAGIDKIADFGYSACDDPSTPEVEFCFVGVQKNGTNLVFFQLDGPTDTDADVTTVPLSGDITSETGTFGANYPVANTRGELFASNNVSGNIFRIVLNYDFNTLSNTTAVGAFTAIGARTNSNDGASCALSASPFPDAVANNDTDSTLGGTPVTTDVTANDSSVPGTSINTATVSAITNPTKGVTVVNQDGTITYTPIPNFTGRDTYVYQVCNDASPVVCDSATVTVDVGPPNQAPVAGDDHVKTAKDAATVIDVIANDSDPDNNLIPSSTIATASPSHGALVNNSNGSFTYTPSAGYVGPDTFAYQACDAASVCDDALVIVFVGWDQLQLSTESTYVAYEDLKATGWSDWDYNDFVARIDIQMGQDGAGQLAALEIDYEALARGAGYYHRFLHRLPLQGGGIATLAVFDGSGTLVSEVTSEFTDDTAFTIFENTRTALPPTPGMFDTNTRPSQPGTVDGSTAKLTIYLNDASANPMAALPPVPWDPYIFVINTEQEVHLLIPGELDNSQVVNSARDPNSPLLGYDLPLAQTFSDGWQWPVEFMGIWRGYEQYTNHIGSGKTDFVDWWRPENAKTQWIWTWGVTAAGVQIFDEAAPDSRYFAGAVAHDLNDDGNSEIIIGNLLKNQVEVSDSLLNPLPGWPQPVEGGIKAAAAIADLDGDGVDEVLVGASDGRLYAWHYNGTLVEGWPVMLNEGFRVLATPAVGDLDGDGSQDVVVPATDGQLYAFNATGVARSGWPISIGDVADQFGGQVINSSPQIVDLDGNGSLEIVVGSTDQHLYAFNADGSVRWAFETDDMVLSTPAVGELDGNTSGLEIVVGSGDSYVYVLNSEATLLWKRPTGWTVRSSPILADIDGDQDLEIIIGSDDDKVWAWHHSGNLVNGWPQTADADVFSSPQVGDVDGDGMPEIVVGSDGAAVYAWHGDGSVVSGWPQSTSSSVKGTPALANLDTDNALEIVAGDLSGRLFSWNGDGRSVIQHVFLPLVVAK
jgi:LruC domain-containing protein